MSIIICKVCKKEVESTGRNQKYCPSCSKIIVSELKTICRVNNREKYNYDNMITRRKKNEHKRYMECPMCGITIKKRSNVQKYCKKCGKKVKIDSSRDNYKSDFKIGEKFNCVICNKLIKRRAAQHKYCNKCKPIVERFRVSHYEALKKNAGGTYTIEDFHNLCDSLNWQCAYCGKQITEDTATRDHVMPVSRGGNNSIDNILPACFSCNASKNNKTKEEYLIYKEEKCKQVN